MSIDFEDKEELLEYLSELEQTISGHSGELQGREEIGYDKAMLEMEGKIQKAFYAGHVSGSNNEEPLRALLNYNMEERL